MTKILSSLIIPNIARPKSSRTPIQQEIKLKPPSFTIPSVKYDLVLIPINGTNPNQPPTPLVTPRVGIPKAVPSNNESSLAQDENPWLPPHSEGSSEIKIAAITPIGTIAMVPTVDKRPPPTPRRLPPTPGTNSTPAQIDPILNATIYLDCTRSEDQDYKHVASKMRTISENTLTLHRQYKNHLKPLINVSGLVSSNIFEDALLIYENNQVYYQDRIDDHCIDLPTIKICLTKLEHWFLCIIEPKDNDDVAAWINREHYKITKGITTYCDPELHQYITPAPIHIINFIINNHIGLF